MHAHGCKYVARELSLSHLYACLFVCTCMWLRKRRMQVNADIHTYRDMHTGILYMHIYIHMCKWRATETCTYHTDALTHARMYMHAHTHTHACIYVYIYIYIYIYLFVYLYMHIYIYIYMFIYLIVYLCVYIYIYIYKCVCRIGLSTGCVNEAA